MIRRGWTTCLYCTMVGPIGRYREHLKEEHDLSDEGIAEIMLEKEKEFLKKQLY